MPDLISRVLRMMNVNGVTVQDIHEMLVGEGLTQRQAYYTYVGARMIYQDSIPILLPSEEVPVRLSPPKCKECSVRLHAGLCCNPTCAQSKQGKQTNAL